MLPLASVFVTTTVIPAITALAGFVPCADCGMRQTLRCLVAARVVIRADHEQAGVLALRARVGLQRHGGEAGDLGQRALQVPEELLVALRLVSGANGCSRPNSGQVTGIISAVAFSFIVQVPSGIIECVSERSRDSSVRM